MVSEKRALGNRWIYKTKYFSNGDIERLKSRLIVFGSQEAGIDYDETFAPVAKMTTVRAFLAIAAPKNWKFHTWMFTMHFFMEILRRRYILNFLQPLSVQILTWCVGCENLYGLKQAPRCWFAKGYGFSRSYSDVFFIHLYKRHSLNICFGVC